MNSEEAGGGLIFLSRCIDYDGVLNFGYLSHGSRLYCLGQFFMCLEEPMWVYLEFIWVKPAPFLYIQVGMYPCIDGELVEAKFPITIEILPESLELIS